MNCGHCDGTGFLNWPDDGHAETIGRPDGAAMLLQIAHSKETDFKVCDCCGDGHDHHGEPGEHAESDFGRRGPYASNGGLPRCA